jgi:photosystem II stability/assembly factor-like uncharacterized protein
MRRSTLAYALGGLVAVAGLGGLVAVRSFSADRTTTVAALASETHVHGFAVDAGDSSRLYLATHHGFYVVSTDGQARPVSANRDDFMGFAPHPTDPSVLYASGHPAAGGNLGVLASTNGGSSWTKISNGAGGPVDFHQMDVSRANPAVIYGVSRDLQRSTDSGRTWSRVGPAPDGLIDLAASGRDADTVYAGTRTGLLKSTDGGRSWRPAHPSRQPVTMVRVTRGGRVYAFVIGVGLVRAGEEDLGWQVVGNDFGGNYVLHLAADPRNGETLFLVTLNPQSQAQALLASRDGGRSWTQLRGD